MIKAFFGQGFSMTVAGQEVVADADGYVDLSAVRATPELLVWQKEDPKATTPDAPTTDTAADTGTSAEVNDAEATTTTEEGDA